jgi:peptidoglycan/xylan/chitin deacetylase (PgdA/CDA1 family)
MRFIVTVDDAGLGQTREVEERSIRFFDDVGVPASFFVIPEQPDGTRVADDPAWIGRARSYESHGFDFQLHGCTHEGFEFGPPEPWMVRICGDDMVKAEAEGFAGMRHLWTREALRERLTRAVAGFEAAFQRRPDVFRAGCLAAGEDAFQLMGEMGLRFDSDKIVNPRAWDLIAGDFDSRRPWDPRVPPFPYRLTRAVTELPCIGEYAWTPTAETAGSFVALAAADMERVDAAGGTFILMCHQQKVGGNDDLPRDVLKEILAQARKTFRAEFLTLRDLVRLVDAGAVPVAAAAPPAP